MNTTLNPEATAYLDAVRDRLKGLPIEEADELVTDLEQHLAELMAEDVGPLADRLGSPQEYAAELAASAGWPAAPSRSMVSLTRPILAWKGRVLRSTAAQWWGRHWPDYRPGWWVMRAVIVVVTWAAIYWSGPTLSDWLWAIPVAALSITAGRRASKTMLWRAADRIATVLGLWALLVAGANGVSVMPQSVIYTYYDHNPNGMVGPNGVVENIYAYDKEGQPIDVFLYDQNGSPIVTDWNQYAYEVSGGDPLIDNFYPTERVINGEVVPRPAIVVPELSGR